MLIRESRHAFFEARKILRELVRKNIVGYPANIYGMARLLGFEIEEAEIQLAGYIPTDESVIIIRQRDKPERKRFTIAHEIGHILLQKVTGDTQKKQTTFRSSFNSLEEELADELAAELLMPMNEFKKVIIQYNTPSVIAVVRISKYFGVSFEACIRRITETPGIIGFSYLYELKKNLFNEYEINIKTSYPKYMLRLTTPPFDIVNKCLTQYFQKGKNLEGHIGFRNGNQLIQIPSIGKVVRTTVGTLVSLFGWKFLNTHSC